MYISLLIFLLASIVPSILTAPPSKPHVSVKCYIHEARNPPHADDCISLLERLSRTPSVQEQFTAGRLQPAPGRIPSYQTAGSCRLALNTVRPTSTETETFKFVQYFPAIYGIISECFGTEGPRYTIGTVGFGQENKFGVHLGGYNLSRLNDTAVWM